eukprot:XP_008764957.1 PREDICTED: uncharacterized protein LOC689479 isoform X2 [Rattus norvegicus]
MYGIRGWKEGHSLRVQLEASFSALSGIHPVSTISPSSPSFWDSEWSFPPMGHQICKLTWVYLSTGFGRKASSQNVISEQEKCLKELEELKLEIQKCQFERDELYQILDLYIYDEWDHRLDVELPILRSEHEMRMMAMQMMTNSISDAMERYKELIQVNNSYRIRHSQLLREQAQLKNKIQILLNEKREQLVEQTELPASSEEAKRLCEEAGMNICDPRAQQQQV